MESMMQIETKGHGNTAFRDACVKEQASDVSALPIFPGAVGLLLEGCGGENRGGSTDNTATGVTPADISLFLSQATVGATRADFASLKTTRFSDWIDQQIDVPMPSNSACWDSLLAYKPAAWADTALWNRILKAQDTLRVRMALALSEFFVISVNQSDVQERPFAAAAYFDLLCSSSFSNLRQLIEDVSLSPAMGNFLNMNGSIKADPVTGRMPDENYPREIMQLFSIGLNLLDRSAQPKLDAHGNPIPTFTQTDVTELARVFTGWKYTGFGDAQFEYYRKPMSNLASDHDNTSATVLGTVIAGGRPALDRLRQVLDVLFNHANAGPFFCKKMIQRLVTSNPSAPYVERVVSVFENNGNGVRGDLKAIFKAILLDPEARASGTASKRKKLSEPMLRFSQWARLFGPVFTPSVVPVPPPMVTTGLRQPFSGFADSATGLGQSPLRAPSVFNFFSPDYQPPNTAISADDLAAPEFQIVDEVSVAAYINFMNVMISNNHPDMTVDYTNWRDLASTPATLVATLNTLLAANRLSDNTVSLILQAVQTIKVATPTDLDSRVKAATLLVMASTEYITEG